MVKDLFGDEMSESEPVTVKGNPCIAIYGPGEIGVTCKNCSHLWKQVED